MRCLIPVHQEIYPKNSLDRAKNMCDEIILMYIVDKKLIERVRRESSYIIPSYALENVENFVVEIHRREAERIRESIKDVSVELRFVVGEYYESIEKEVLRDAPDLIMCDSFLRGFLKLPVPVWIDRGLKIQECTIIISSLRKINRIKKGMELAERICEKLGSALYLHYPPKEEIGMEALRPLGRLVEEPCGELLVLLREDLRSVPEERCVLIL